MIRRALSEITFRARTLFRRGAVERELDAELRFHIDRETEKLVREGLSRGEAQRRARATFGGLERIKDDTRDAHGVALVAELGADLRYAIRTLAAHKAFTFGVMVTLALGIGANATMFGIVDRLLFRAPPALRDPATVHRLYRFIPDQGVPRADRNFPYATYLDLGRDVRAFSAIAAFQTNPMAVGDGDAVREVPVTAASANYFDFFSARPVAGRFFTASEDVAPQGANVVVLGYGYWQSELGGRDVLGQSLRVGAVAATIIGVAPPGFVGMSDQGVPAAYIPITTYAYSLRPTPDYPRWYTWSWLEMIGRRRAEASEEAATADLAGAFFSSWRRAYEINPRRFGKPEDQHITAAITPVQINRGPQAGRDARVSTWIGGVAFIVLLIACANVANLLLSRAVHRRREIAVRLALGAGSGRLIRQLLTESLVLAALGTVAGLALAEWGASGLRRWFLPADLEVGVFTDPRTLAFAGATTLVVALLTGLVPALRAGRAELSGDLKSGTRGAGTQHARMRAGLLVFQTALSVVLFVGAALFVRSLGNAAGRPIGYDVDNLLYATMQPRGVRLDQPELAGLAERLRSAALSVPGVTSATRAQSVPFAMNDQRSLSAPGVDSVGSRGTFIFQVGSLGYFKTMGTRILRGRPFDESDTRNAPKVVVVSEGMARAIWRDRDALGQCLQFANVEPSQRRCMTIIGIAEEMHLRLFDDPREFAYYVPEAQYDGPFETPRMLVRTSGAAAHVADALRRRIQEHLPGAAYAYVTPMSRLVEPNLRSWRLGATMFAAFGALALLIAAVGLYSLVAYDVAQRRRELSVRIALGASGSRLVGWVVARATRIVTVGLVVGASVASWVAPALKEQLFRQEARDPAVFVLVIATLLAVGVVAALIPAIRASRVDPNEALRSE